MCSGVSGHAACVSAGEQALLEHAACPDVQNVGNQTRASGARVGTDDVKRVATRGLSVLG